MIRYFVTGTDTGVGKTYVTALLAQRARVLGHRVFAFKPIETGVADELGDDQRVLVDAAGGWQTGELRGLYRFPKSVAPRVAAQAAGTTIDVARIVELVRTRTEDVILVEGAGGWRVPITEAIDMAGLAGALGAPVIVVARAGLGTINHSLLTIEAVERDGLTVAGLVISQRPADDRELARSSVQEIQRCWAGRVRLHDDLDDLLRST